MAIDAGYDAADADAVPKGFHQEPLHEFSFFLIVFAQTPHLPGQFPAADIFGQDTLFQHRRPLTE